MHPGAMRLEPGEALGYVLLATLHPSLSTVYPLRSTSHLRVCHNDVRVSKTGTGKQLLKNAQVAYSDASYPLHP
jgi:hypothetical protein